MSLDHGSASLAQSFPFQKVKGVVGHVILVKFVLLFKIF